MKKLWLISLIVFFCELSSAENVAIFFDELNVHNLPKTRDFKINNKTTIKDIKNEIINAFKINSRYYRLQITSCQSNKKTVLKDGMFLTTYLKNIDYHISTKTSINCDIVPNPYEDFYDLVESDKYDWSVDPKCLSKYDIKSALHLLLHEYEYFEDKKKVNSIINFMIEEIKNDRRCNCLNQRDITEKAPLHLAVAKNLKEIVKSLLSAGSLLDVNLKDGNGDTALLIAIKNENYRLAELIIDSDEIDIDNNRFHLFRAIFKKFKKKELQDKKRLSLFQKIVQDEEN